MQFSRSKVNQKFMNEKGNALFLILIAVALFAALSYAVTQSGRSGGGVDREQVILKASQVTQYAANIEQAITRMRVINGCADTDISFANSTIAGYEHTPVQPSECRVFEVDGGGLSYDRPQTSWLDTTESAESLYGYYHLSGRSCLFEMPNDGASCWSDGLDNEELFLSIHYIDKDICMEINDNFGITNPSGDAPEDIGCAVSSGKFKGIYGEATGVNTTLDPATDAFSGKFSGCYKAKAGCVGVPTGYHFYHVLIAR